MIYYSTVVAESRQYTVHRPDNSCMYPTQSIRYSESQVTNLQTSATVPHFPVCSCYSYVICIYSTFDDYSRCDHLWHNLWSFITVPMSNMVVFSTMSKSDCFLVRSRVLTHNTRAKNTTTSIKRLLFRRHVQCFLHHKYFTTWNAQIIIIVTNETGCWVFEVWVIWMMMSWYIVER